MEKDKGKVPLDKLLLNDVSNKYRLIILTSKALKEKVKKDGKTKIDPVVISQVLYEVASKEAEKKGEIREDIDEKK